MRISLGRFVPGDSLIHRADPRTKLIWTIVMMVLVLMCSSWRQYLAAAVFVIGCFALSGISFKYILMSLRPIMLLLAITVIFNLLFFKGTDVLFTLGALTVYKEGVLQSVKTIIRVSLLIISASLLTYTTSSVAITDGMESLMRPLAKIGFPAHEVAMMMSIALRFVPTFADETDKIMKAQAARGADFDSGNVFKKVKSYIPVLIPLFVGAFKSAEDMATAMESRCYKGGKGRTRYKVLKFSSADLIMLIVTLVFTATVILLKYVFKI